MAAYYNEIEPYAAQWLRNLIKAGHIADGEVDTRSIVDVHPFDLQGFDQCHFFAGIGGWSHALRLAGWPDSRPVWTGSCPCQPFSIAGKGGGVTDKRHLWPEFHRLIRACRPTVVMGEQVAGKAGYGWFDGVRADLEATGYSSRAVDIPALAVNAPHIRQRLYWGACDMADADQGGRGRWPHDGDGERNRQAGGRVEDHRQPAGGGEDRLDLADAQSGGRGQGIADARGVREGDSSQGPTGRSAQYDSASFWDNHIWLTGSDGKSRRSQPGLPLLAHGIPARVGKLRAYGNAIAPPLAAEVIKAFMMGDDRWM